MMEEQISRLEKLQCESESAKSKHKKKLSTATAAKFELPHDKESAYNQQITITWKW